MIFRTIIVLLVGMFLVKFASADTLTLRSNAEINGEVQYDDDAFTVTSHYHSGNQTVTFDRHEILTLEINSRVFNPGEPPTNISILDPRAAVTKDASHDTSMPRKNGQKKPESKQSQSSMIYDNIDREITDVIWLRDKTRLIGRLTSLQKGYLTIQNGDATKRVAIDKVATVLVAPN
jgi:hypothetical protein